jgi:hypothetical protein
MENKSVQFKLMCYRFYGGEFHERSAKDSAENS